MLAEFMKYRIIMAAVTLSLCSCGSNAERSDGVSTVVNSELDRIVGVKIADTLTKDEYFIALRVIKVMLKDDYYESSRYVSAYKEIEKANPPFVDVSVSKLPFYLNEVYMVGLKEESKRYCSGLYDVENDKVFDISISQP